MTTPDRPTGLAAIRARFGNPLDFASNPTAWERTMIASRALVTPLPYAHGAATITHVRAHHLIAPELTAALQACLDAGVPLERMRYSGCYNWRPKRGGSQLSLHTWGLAVDIEPAANPRGERWRDDGKRLHPSIIETFIKRRWVWGNEFSTPDPMHFQWASGY